MRALMLLRAARAAAAALGPAVWPAAEACGPASLPQRAVTQFTSLMGLQLQQQAGLAAARHTGDSDSDEDEAVPGRHSKLSHSARRLLIQRKLQMTEEESDLLQEGGMGEEGEAARERIGGLLHDLGHASAGGAAQFVSSFFGGRQQAAAAAAETDDDDHRYKGEGGRVALPNAPLRREEGGEEESAELAEDEGVEGEPDDAEAADGGLQVALPEAMDAQTQDKLQELLAGLRPGSRRIMLQKLLEGGIMQIDPSARAEWEAIQEEMKPPSGFRMKVVDVNRTCKGTRTGGLYRYSCMVVVGNGNGVLGWGQGKAAEVADAVQKAYARACNNLCPVPRYNDHTIPEPVTAKFGQVKVVMYPKASGNGIMANALMHEICKMAGLHDVGIKVHGSRNVRNAVKCVFKALEQIRTEEDILEEAEQAGKLVVRMPPGRYSQLRL